MQVRSQQLFTTGLDNAFKIRGFQVSPNLDMKPPREFNTPQGVSSFPFKVQGFQIPGFPLKPCQYVYTKYNSVIISFNIDTRRFWRYSGPEGVSSQGLKLEWASPITHNNTTEQVLRGNNS